MPPEKKNTAIKRLPETPGLLPAKARPRRQEKNRPEKPGADPKATEPRAVRTAKKRRKR